MIDDQGCNEIGHHQLCCPPADEAPKCGWYGHKNGKCNEMQCPTGMVEVGSNNMHCNKKTSYQAACCTATTRSMHLYNGCNWTPEYPNCNKGSCGSSLELARSWTGSGGAFCNDIPNQDAFSNEYYGREERKYCCRDDLPDQKWSECEWYTNLGLFPKDWAKSKGYCLSGCPDDKVRIAMDHNTKACSRGARAKCCTPAYASTKSTSPKDDKELADALDVYLDKPQCVKDTQSYRFKAQDIVIDRLYKMLFGSVGLDTINTWDTKVGSKNRNLKYKGLRTWARKDERALTEGADKITGMIVCEMEAWNRYIGGEDWYKCHAGKRDLPKRSLTTSSDLFLSDYHQDLNTSSANIPSLQKRDQEYAVEAWSSYANVKVVIKIWGINVSYLTSQYPHLIRLCCPLWPELGLLYWYLAIFPCPALGILIYLGSKFLSVAFLNASDTSFCI